VVRSGSPVGARAVSEDKSIAKMLSGAEPMKNTPIRVCDKTAFVTLTTGIILLSFTCMPCWVWGNFTNDVWSACVCRQPMKWSEIAESLRNTALHYHHTVSKWAEDLIFNTYRSDLSNSAFHCPPGASLPLFIFMFVLNLYAHLLYGVIE
jgi:hypothetical protein